MPAREPPWEGEDELVADLVQLGLTRNEARLYLAADGRPPLRASELAELAGVTRTKAYGALHQLVEKGMLRRQPGRVARFEAADPRLVARQLRQRGVEDQAMLVADTGAPVGDPPSPREGVRHRSVYELGALDALGFRERVAGREARGEELRFAERVAVGLCVVDRRTSFIGLEEAGDAGGPGTWLVLEHPGLSTTLGDAFDLAWARARRA